MMSTIKINKQNLKFELSLMLWTLSLTAPCVASNIFDQNYQNIKIEVISNNGDA